MKKILGILWDCIFLTPTDFILRWKVHELWKQVASDQPQTERHTMPKDAIAELAEIKAAYEAQKVKIQALIDAADSTNETVPTDVQNAIDALATEVEGDSAPTTSSQLGL